MQTALDSPLPIYSAQPRPLEWIALIAILALAAILRLGWPGTVEFKRDEANLSALTLNMVHGQGIPLLGIDSSVGIRNPPISVYLMAPPYIVSSSPVLATLYVGLLNVIAVGLLYALARRYYGPRAAMITGLLYAVSPWAVVYSRKIWAQDLLPVFVLLTVGSGLLGFLEGKRKAQFVHLPLLAITGQIHYGAFVLIPVTLALIALGRRRIQREFAFSFVLTSLVVLPYALGVVQASLSPQDAGQKFVNASSTGGQPSNPITLTLDALRLAAQSIGGTQIAAQAGPTAQPQLEAQFGGTLPLLDALFDGLAVVVILAAIWLLVRIVRRDARAPVDLIVLIWLAFTPLVFSITWTPVYPHYMIIMLPAAYLAVGAVSGKSTPLVAAPLPAPSVRETGDNVNVVTVVGLFAVAIIVSSQVWVQVAFLNFVATHDTPGGFATPLGDYIPVRDAILKEHPQAVLASLDGQYVGFNEETTVWNTLLLEVPSVRYVNDSLEVYPADKALLLSHGCNMPGAIQTFHLRPGEGCYALSWRAANDLDYGAFQPTNSEGLTFASGAQITAYR